MDADARRLGAYLALGGLMVVLDTTVLIVALPRLIEAFDSDLPTVQWVTTGFALALVAVMPTAAWAMGRFGSRNVYLAALTMFTGGSLLTGLAWDVPSLILFRVLQGLGGGLLTPTGMAIALAAIPAERRGQMMSFQGLPVLVGPLIGPVLGGVLVDHASWRWIFWINVPLGAAALIAGRRILPSANPRTPTRLDVIGLLLLSPGLALAVFGLSNAGEHASLTAPTVLLPCALGLAMVGAFLRRAWRAPHPLLHVRVLTRPAMAAGIGTLGLFAAAYFGSAVIGPLYVQVIRGDGATVAGEIGLPQALATGLTLQIATRLVDRLQPRVIIGTGISLAVLGTTLRVLVLGPHTPYVLFGGLGALSGVGVGATLMPTMTAATRSLSGPDLRSGTTLLNIVSQTAVATGTSLLTATMSYAVALFAPDLPAGGLRAAAGFPPSERADVAPALADAARAALVAAVVLMVLALLVSRRLPRERHDPDPAGQPAPASG